MLKWRSCWNRRTPISLSKMYVHLTISSNNKSTSIIIRPCKVNCLFHMNLIPTHVRVCNIEKLGMGPGMRLLLHILVIILWPSILSKYWDMHWVVTVIELEGETFTLCTVYASTPISTDKYQNQLPPVYTLQNSIAWMRNKMFTLHGAPYRVYFRILLKRGQKSSAKFVGGQTQILGGGNLIYNLGKTSS